MIFRKSELADCAAVYDLICDLENTALDYGNFSRIYAAQLCSNSYFCLLAASDLSDVALDSGQNILGLINLRFEEQMHHAAKIAEILEFVVKEDWRKKGIGKALLQRAGEIAKSCSCSQIEVCCNQSRNAAHKFYLAAGFINSHYKFCKKIS